MGKAAQEPLPQRALDVPPTGEEDEDEFYSPCAKQLRYLGNVGQSSVSSAPGEYEDGCLQFLRHECCLVLRTEAEPNSDRTWLWIAYDSCGDP